MLTVANLALRRFLRERSNVFFVFILPFLIIFLVGFSVDRSATLAVSGADTDLGRELLAAMEGQDIELHGSADAARRAVETSQSSAAMLVVEAGDGSDSSVVFVSRPGVGVDARMAVEQAVGAVDAERSLRAQAEASGVDSDAVDAAVASVAAVEVENDIVGTEIWAGLDQFDASALTQVVLFMFLSALTASSALIQERDLGMSRRKAATPNSALTLVAGETLGRFWIAMFQAALIVIVSGVAFGVDWGDPLATAVVLCLFGLVATGTGILLGSALDNAEVASGVGIMGGLVLAALGGAMAPVEIFPDAMQSLARFVPHYWAIEGLKVTVAGGGVTEIGRPLTVLAATAAAILVLSTWFYRRRVYGGR